jgi:hypothetical protein
VAQAKTAKGATDTSQIEKQLQSVKQLGQQLQAAIKSLTKQQSQGATGGGATGGGATGGGAGNPLNGLGTGGL